MAAILDRWTVQPHEALVEVDRGLLTVAGEIRMPLGNFPRRMTVVGLADGTTAIWSAIALDEPQMARIEALGRPAFLIVPGIAHRLDARIWKQRYPDLQVLCAPAARDAVAEAVAVNAVTDVLNDPEVSLSVVPGVGSIELAMQVRRPGGTTLVLNDTLANVRHPHGPGAQIMARLMGFGVHRPRVPRVAARMFVKDRAALRAAFREWAADPALRRIIVSHGDVIESDPARALTDAAARLKG